MVFLGASIAQAGDWFSFLNFANEAQREKPPMSAMESAAELLGGALRTQVSVLTLLLTLAVGAAGFALYWKRLSASLQRDLKIEVKRGSPPKPAGGGGSVKRTAGRVNSEAASEAAKAPFIAALELNPEVAGSAPFSAHSLCSLGDYFRSLDVGPGGLSLERVAASLMAKAGYGALLPAVNFLAPESAKAALPGGADALVGGFSAALFRKLLSPLKIYAITSALNEASADAAELDLDLKDAVPGEKDKAPAIASFITGEQDGLTPPYPASHSLPMTFVMERDVAAIAEAWGLSPGDTEARRSAPEPDPGSADFLPDLCFSYGGIGNLQGPWRDAVSRILAKVLNRLAANAVVAPAMAKFAPRSGPASMVAGPFTVYMTEAQEARRVGGITRPDQLVEELAKRGHRAEMGIVSRVTSFGFGMSVKERDGSYTNIPLLMPLDSGLQLLTSSDAADTAKPGDMITVPACHAGLFLEIKGPLVECKVEWYQGIEGFTGWHNGNDLSMVWCNDEAAEVRHDKPSWSNPEQWRAAFETSTVASIALNVAATRSRLPNGGYGYLGICMDSAAAIQQALTGEVTLFPLILGGRAKTSVMLLYKELEAALAKSDRPELANAAAALRLAMFQVPADIIHQPQDTVSICDRMLAMLPERSPFAMIAKSREKVRRLRKQAEALSADSSQNAKQFSNTRSKSFGKGGIKWMQIQPPWGSSPLGSPR